ncbi:MAG: hypothetical protein LW696_07825 [Alphaproteobacteria bacterium]|nr:hypothetical protein [Alphaproteobacteria bacterium]
MSVGNEGAAPAAPNALNVGGEAPAMDASQVQGQEAEGSAEGQTPSEKAEIKRLNKLKLKVHGEEFEEELPFEIEEDPEVVEYLTKNLQLGKAAQRAMQEKATYEQQVKQFFQGMKSNTREYLMQMGIDPKEFAAAVIEEEIKKAQLTPEQLKEMELQEELKKEREARQKEREEFEQRELSRLQQVEYERIDNQMTEALETSDLPKTPYVVRKMAEYMLIEDAAEDFIGKEVMTRMRKKNVAKAKAMTPATAKAAIKEVASSTKTKADPKDKVDYKKFFGF